LQRARKGILKKRLTLSPPTSAAAGQLICPSVVSQEQQMGNMPEASGKVQKSGYDTVPMVV
jgi:hypothetical protein